MPPLPCILNIFAEIGTPEKAVEIRNCGDFTRVAAGMAQLRDFSEFPVRRGASLRGHWVFRGEISTAKERRRW
jgi:hypothetical protein